MSESIGVRALGYTRVKSVYSSAEIARKFGLEPKEIRRLARAGLAQPVASTAAGDEYDFQGLVLFRRVRDLRARGLTFAEIEAELSGQPYLFPLAEEPPREAEVVSMRGRAASGRGPFEEGLALAEAGDPRAEAAFRQAVAEGDHTADAYCNLAPLALRAGRRAEAFDCLTLALREDPRHPEAHFNLATFYLDMGQYALARLHYELATAIEPYFADAYYNLGLACADLGDYEAARRALETYRELAREGSTGIVDGLLALLQVVEKAPTQGPTAVR